MKRFVLLIFFVSLITGCAWYSHNNVRYYSKDKALQAQQKDNERYLSQITPLNAPYGSVLVVIPSYKACSTRGIIKHGGGELTPDVINYLGRHNSESTRYMGLALRRYNLFKRVEIEEADYPGTYGPQRKNAFDVVVYLRISDPNMAQWFLSSADSVEETPIYMDKSTEIGVPRTLSWLKYIEKIMKERIRSNKIKAATTDKGAKEPPVIAPKVEKSETPLSAEDVEATQSQLNERLRKLKAMKELDLLSQDEYEREKAKIEGK